MNWRTANVFERGGLAISMAAALRKRLGIEGGGVEGGYMAQPLRYDQAAQRVEPLSHSLDEQSKAK